MTEFDPHHYAFATDDETFDAVLVACEAGLHADPLHERLGALNANNVVAVSTCAIRTATTWSSLTRPITG